MQKIQRCLVQTHLTTHVAANGLASKEALLYKRTRKCLGIAEFHV